jgi:hypothetical protein
VGQQRLAPVVLARADDERGGQRREPRAHLHRHTAGEVERSVRGEPAAAERPVRQDGVDADRPQRGEGQERAEAHPLDDGAGHERHRDDAEGRLEGHEQELRDGGPLARDEGDVVQERLPEPTEQVAGAVERERVPDRCPRHHGDRDRGDAHHERVERVLRADETGVEEAQRRRHHEDEGGCGEHPRRVPRAQLGDGSGHPPTGVTAP